MVSGGADEFPNRLERRIRTAVGAGVAVSALLVALATPWYQVGADDPRTLWDPEPLGGDTYAVTGWAIVAAVVAALVAATAPSRESAVAVSAAAVVVAGLEALVVARVVQLAGDDGDRLAGAAVHLRPGPVLAATATLLLLAMFVPAALGRRG